MVTRWRRLADAWLPGVSVTTWQWLAVMRRRWPVLVIGLLCTVCAVWAVHKRPISYQACGSIIVGAPTTQIHPNIYNNGQGSLVAAVGLVTEELQSPTAQQDLRAHGATAIYQAQMHNTGTTETPSYREPEMDACAYSRDPQMSVHTADAALTEFGAVLHAREVAAHVDRRYFMTVTVLAAPGAVADAGRPSQAYLGVGVIGLILAITGALWTDQYLLRRQHRARQDITRAARMPVGHARGSR